MPKNDNYYGKPRWTGTAYLWYRGILLERGLYVCHARETGIHAVPVPKIYVPIEGEFSVEAEEWIGHRSSGEKLYLPAKDDKLSDVVGWTPRSTRSALLPGQLTVVKSNYSHRLIGNGKIAILYFLPDSIEGQELLNRGDYDIGLAVTSPPKFEMSDVLRQLAPLCEKQSNGTKEQATEIYAKIVAMVKPAYKPLKIGPEWLGSLGRRIRNRCRLKRFQCEHNARIYLCDLARYVGYSPKGLEKIFREYFKTRVCHYVRFLHHTAAMQYYGEEQRRASRESKNFDISMTELAVEVNYSDAPQFTREFEGFHGIAPVMFFRNTHFILIDM